MTLTLTPPEPLSQVVFVHDYVQLVFQDERFSIYNTISLADAEETYRQGQHGFCDAVVKLLGQRARSVVTSEGQVLALSFDGGTRLLVHVGGSRPEAFEFHGRNGRVVVEQNA